MDHKEDDYHAKGLIWDEKNAKEIFDLFPIAILITNIETRRNVYINPKFTETYGYTLSEIYERDTWLEKAYPNKKYRSFVDGLWKKDLFQDDKNNSPPRVLNVQTKKGEIVKTKFRLMNIRNEKAFILAEDVSEKKKLESELHKSEQKYRHLFEESPFAIVLLNRTGEIVECNSTAEKLLGYSRKELIDDKKKFISLIPRKYHLIIAKRIKSVNRRGEIPSEDIQLKTKNNNLIWINAKSSLIEFKDNLYFQIIFYDITDRKNMEESVRKSEKRYRKAYNYSQFLRDLFSHDVNNLFQSLYSISDLLELYLSNRMQDELRNIPEIIKNQVKKGEDLIRNVDLLTEIEESSLSITKMDIRKLLKEVIQIIKRRYPKELLDIKLEFKCENAYISGHEFLGKTLDNLLVNSIQHNESSPKQIQILVSEIEKESKEFIKLEISDNGIGISDLQKKNLFDYDNIFEVQKKRMGLGLFLVKKIVEEISGVIWIEDRVKGEHKKGANFVLLFPKT
jgi:PAS domain S-box-containing protein